MPEYGVSSEKRVHTGVSSRCVLCNNIVTCVHSTETRFNTEFCDCATTKVLFMGELRVTLNAGYDIMLPVKQKKIWVPSGAKPCFCDVADLPVTVLVLTGLLV